MRVSFDPLQAEKYIAHLNQSSWKSEENLPLDVYAFEQARRISQYDTIIPMRIPVKSRRWHVGIMYGVLIDRYGEVEPITNEEGMRQKFGKDRSRGRRVFVIVNRKEDELEITKVLQSQQMQDVFSAPPDEIKVVMIPTRNIYQLDGLIYKEIDSQCSEADRVIMYIAPQNDEGLVKTIETVTGSMGIKILNLQNIDRDRWQEGIREWL